MALLPFDNRDGFIWFDGKLVPWRDAKLHVFRPQAIPALSARPRF
jgi:hypothetical protein